MAEPQAPARDLIVRLGFRAIRLGRPALRRFAPGGGRVLSLDAQGFGAIAQLGERVLCKHEVVGSIPSGSTRTSGERAGRTGPGRRSSHILPMQFISFVGRGAWSLSTGVDERPYRFEARSLSISDIVKRKRIRSRAGWGEASSRRAVRRAGLENRFVFIRLFQQPVVGLEPDRSDPRMRLKQNWSFQCRRATFPSIAD
jgi:hypothetical protein